MIFPGENAATSQRRRWSPRVQENGSNLRFLLDNSLDQLKAPSGAGKKDGRWTVMDGYGWIWMEHRPNLGYEKIHDVLRFRNAAHLSPRLNLP